MEQKRKVKAAYDVQTFSSSQGGVRYMLYCAQLFLTLCSPMDCTCQVPLPMEISRQEYRSVLPFSTPGNLS